MKTIMLLPVLFSVLSHAFSGDAEETDSESKYGMARKALMGEDLEEVSNLNLSSSGP